MTFESSSSNRTGCFCVIEKSSGDLNHPGGECRRKAAGSRFVRRPRRSNRKGPPQNLFCGERKAHPRNHSKTARPIGRAVFAFSGAEAGLGSTYTGETKGGARSASLSQADERLPAQFPCPRPKRRGVTGGTWFLSPAQFAPGAPFDQTASVAAQSDSLRHCAALAARGRSRAARFAVPQWRFRRNARDQEGAALCGDRGGQMQKGPRKTCFAGKANPIPATMLSDQNGYTHLKPLRNQEFQRFYALFFQSVIYRYTRAIQSVRQDLN